jgi:hypothetical protein
LVSFVARHLSTKLSQVTMSTAAAASKPEDVIKADLKKAPEDIEAQAVTKKIAAAEKEIKSELCEAIDDHLEDELLPPLDIIVKVLKKMVPKCIAAIKTKLDKCLSSLPCSGLLHLVLIEMMAVYIFYFSTQNVLRQAVISAKKEEEKDKPWPEAAKVDKCLNEIANRFVWLGEHFDANSVCFDKDEVEGPYAATEDTSGTAWIIGAINFGCLLLCCLLWFNVVGNFVWHSSCRIWVRYHSGTYLKCAFFTRRSYLYRYICGLIGLGAVLAVFLTMFICAKADILGWFLQYQLGNLLMVIVSARAFLTPTKPKFEYKDLNQLNFKRSTFFQTNGAFATTFSNALIQSVRGEQFRTSLVKLLEKSEDWELALKLCVTSQGTTGSNGNKVLLDLWSKGQANLPNMLSSAKEAASYL